MTGNAAAPLRINVLDPAFYVDPWGAYGWLRDEAPVFWDPVQRLWAISRYDDVLAVERDGSRYSSFSGSRPHIDQREDESMINMDDPEHQQQRNLVVRRFTPHGVRNHEDHVREVATSIVDDIVPLGECEAIEAIASRLPAIVIGDLLGYPRSQWERVRYWSERVMLLAGQTSPDGPPHAPDPELGPVITEFVEVTSELIGQRRADPRDDLISAWVAQGWSTKKVLDETILVLNGGAETTRTVTGTMIRDLALHPRQRQTLVERPELLGAVAVDEFIRWVSPILNMRRTATEDHELRGQPIHAGDELLLMYAAANRDERAFDDPDVLDVSRSRGNRHVAFGFGTHFCLGAHLARLELRVMFEELLRRIPEWELVDPDEPQVLPATFARAYDRIRIRFPGEQLMDTIEGRLGAWLATQLPDASEVRVEGLDRIEVGHSAETLIVAVVIDGERSDVVIRVRPEPPGLLEPYDLHRQFTILRALEPTPVRSPRALWYEPSGEVLGRDFYVMERLPGRVIERGVPDDVATDRALARRMCESMIEEIAAIHMVDLDDVRLADLASGGDYLTRELDHWSAEIERVKRGTLPALELLVDELRTRQPEPCPRVTLVHGDTKPGNFAFVDGEVSAVFDWEMATVGDPLADIGWAEVNWRFPGFVTAADGAPSADELVRRWEALTGIRALHRPWYRALQGLKIAVILLVGGRLYGSGQSTDPRLLEMAHGVAPLTAAALADLGVADAPDAGPVLPA